MFFFSKIASLRNNAVSAWNKVDRCRLCSLSNNSEFRLSEKCSEILNKLLNHHLKHVALINFRISIEFLPALLIGELPGLSIFHATHQVWTVLKGFQQKQDYWPICEQHRSKEWSHQKCLAGLWETFHQIVQFCLHAASWLQVFVKGSHFRFWVFIQVEVGHDQVHWVQLFLTYDLISS